ncbi:MAG TPA: AI-2E family transporter [Polyangia bacterium]|jgi:predicted PurR-regulated permease PerM|nr:AI-2E family transporter [Polyangia bacterium]
MTRALADTVADRVSTARAAFPRWNARRILLANLVVLGVAACFALLFQLAAALFILFVGVSLGMAVKPGVEWLRRHGVPRWAGALAIYAALGCVCAGVLTFAVPVVAERAAALVARAPYHFERLRTELLSSDSHTLQRIAWYLPAGVERTGAPAINVQSVLETGSAIGRNLFTVVAVLLIGFYWTLEGDRRMRALVLFAPFDRRRAIRGFITDVEHTVGAYLRGQSLVCLIIGVLAFIIYRLLGLPHAGLVGVVYAIGEAIPVVGPLIGTSVAAMVAASVGPSLVLGVVVAAVFLQLFENYVLIPRVMVRAVGTNPLVTLLAITAFAQVLGIAGAILAIPLAAIVQLLLSRFLLGADVQHGEPPAGRGHLSAVRYEVRELIVDLRKLAPLTGASRSAERVEDAIEGIAHDLDRLLAKRERRS